MKETAFFKCTVASAAVHAALLGLVLFQPLYFSQSRLVSLKKTPPMQIEEDELSLLKKELAMQEALQDLIVLPSQARLPHDMRRKLPPEDDSATIDEQPLVFSNAFHLPSPDQHLLPISLPEQPLEPSATISATVAHLDLHLSEGKPTIEHLRSVEDPFEGYAASLPTALFAQDNSSLDFKFIPSQEKTSVPHFAATPLPISSHLTPSLPHLSSKGTSAPTTSHTLYTSPLYLKQPHHTPSFDLPTITAYGIPDLSSADWNEFFEMDVKIFPREEGGFLFSLTLLPKVDLSKHHLPQTYYFLIDRSNSIEKHRYQTFKRAVTRAIGCLKEGDHFNVIIFDTKIARLNDTPLPYTKKNERLAEDFLEKQPHGHWGAATDIYSSLSKVIPTEVDDSQVHTAILLSDGDSPLKPEKQRKLIQAWLKENRGKVSLYTAAAGQGNNLPSLDLLATAGGGSFIYSDTHTGFPRKLAKQILALRFPIAKELSFSISGAKMQLSPPPTRLPSLFSDHPFVLYGQTDKLSDFTLTLEGRNKDKLLSIKKKISFAEAKQASRLLSKQWTIQLAQQCYEQYLQEGKTSLLEEAKKLLSDDTTHPRR
jgi:hypothetical protein